MCSNPQLPMDLTKFIEEIFSKKLHSLCSVSKFKFSKHSQHHETDKTFSSNMLNSYKVKVLKSYCIDRNIHNKRVARIYYGRVNAGKLRTIVN